MSTENALAIDQDLKAAIEKAALTIKANADSFDLQYPGDTTVDNFYQLRSYDPQYAPGANYGWTTCFWTGELWAAYQLTGDVFYKNQALRHIESFARRVRERQDLHTHDLGFLYTLSSVIPAELCPEASESPAAKEAALQAAERLMDRYLKNAGVIQAWGDLTDVKQQGRVIIDSLLNMPLLFWASEVSGDTRFADAATAHIRQLEQNIIRDDHTTFHTFHFDPLSGAPKFGSTQQGHADDSCWARGQAWGILGFALAYQRLGDPALLEASQRCAQYYMEHLPQDLVPYWDMVFTDGDDEPRDSSAAAIAACGLLELAEITADQGSCYRQLAEDTARSLAQNYAPDLEVSDALLLHSVYSLPEGNGVDEGSLWGDYFYMELLTRLTLPGWKPYWKY